VVAKAARRSGNGTQAGVEMRIVGHSVPRKEGVDKVMGRAQYIDDITMPGMWHGATVRSKIARGTIKSISFDPKINWDEFVVVTAADLPAENYIAHILNDHTCLADKIINHPEEPIVLLAHPDKARLHAAVEAVTIEYEKLHGVFTIEESEKLDPIIWGEDNCFKSYLMEKGDVDAVWAQCRAHRGGRVPHRRAGAALHIENHGVIAECSAEDGVTVWGSHAVPLLRLHKRNARAPSSCPRTKLRVVQAETGGAFGGKEDYPSVHGHCHAALLARKSGQRPVKMVYDRMEDHGRDHQAPSRTRTRHIAPHSTRTASCSASEIQSRHRWRRVRHALVRRALARHASMRPGHTTGQAYA
jgi:CO/xanthine dehydrogenase Mo-binding subunit